MPEDCLEGFKFHFGPTDDHIGRQEELKLMAEHSDPFADIYRELGTHKTGIDTKDLVNQKMTDFETSSGMNTNFTEGMEFDFF